jgi:hypothetical protein
VDGRLNSAPAHGTPQKADAPEPNVAKLPRNNHLPFLLSSKKEALTMGRSILLLLLGVPIPIIILLALFWH